jgi:hypothetical protein
MLARAAVTRVELDKYLCSDVVGLVHQYLLGTHKDKEIVAAGATVAASTVLPARDMAPLYRTTAKTIAAQKLWQIRLSEVCRRTHHHHHHHFSDEDDDGDVREENLDALPVAVQAEPVAVAAAVQAAPVDDGGVAPMDIGND